MGAQVNGSVLLIDGRGFWRKFLPSEVTRLPDGAVRPRTQIWQHVRFNATGDPGTFIANAPAIGPDNGSTDDFYRPGGWNRPEE